MKVSDLAHHELFTAQADETLDQAADRMSWHQVGALPVFDGQRLVGIITERDLTAAVAEEVDPATTPVADYMTSAPEVLQPDSELADAAHTMLQLGSGISRSCSAGAWSGCCPCGTCWRQRTTSCAAPKASLAEEPFGRKADATCGRRTS